MLEPTKVTTRQHVAEGKPTTFSARIDYADGSNSGRKGFTTMGEAVKWAANVLSPAKSAPQAPAKAA